MRHSRGACANRCRCPSPWCMRSGNARANVAPALSPCVMRLYNISPPPRQRFAEAYLSLIRVSPFPRTRTDDAARRSRTSARVARRPVRWALIGCALLLALLWQSVLTQAHHHTVASGSLVAAASNGKVGGGDPASDTPATCPICLEVANAGPAMLPTPVVLAVPAPTAAFTAQARHPVFQLPRQPHVWRSRAPPQLHA